MRDESPTVLSGPERDPRSDGRFLLRAKHGAGYQPPAATGVFADVPFGHPFARFIEALSNEAITGGCGTNPPRYCADQSVTRAEMAVFLVRAFGLPL